MRDLGEVLLRLTAVCRVAVPAEMQSPLFPWHLREVQRLCLFAPSRSKACTLPKVLLRSTQRLSKVGRVRRPVRKEVLQTTSHRLTVLQSYREEDL